MSRTPEPTDRVHVRSFTIYGADDEIHYLEDTDLGMTIQRGRAPNARGGWAGSEGATILVELNYEMDKVHHVTVASDVRLDDIEEAITRLAAVRDHLYAMENQS